MSVQLVRWWLMVVSLTILLLAFGAVLWATWRHHRQNQAKQVNFHASLSVEMAWTLAPCVMVLLLVWPAVRGLLLR
ncbi:MAG: hypothetical protein OHK0048_08470 [Rhodoferax sp.]